MDCSKGADWVLALLPQLVGDGRVLDLVGHSLGGLVACRVAAASPLVRRLVLEDVGLTVPVLAIGGGPASFVPQDSVATLVDTVGDGTLVTIAAGHEVHAGEPTAYVAALRDHLDV